MPPTIEQAHPDDWDAHWQTYSEANHHNPAQVYRQRLVFDLLGLRDVKGPVRLLDLGSGTGEMAQEVARVRPDAEIVGLDLAESGCEHARRKVKNGRFFQQDFTQPMKLPKEYEGWATMAICSEVLEHLDNPTAMLTNVRPYLAKGCNLAITVPGGPVSAFDRFIGHRGHFTPEGLRGVIENAGYDVADLRGAGFPFFNLYRMIVVARGDALIKDMPKDGGDLPLTARAVIRVFSTLFKLNTSKTRLGWQLAAVAVPR